MKGLYFTGTKSNATAVADAEQGRAGPVRQTPPPVPEHALGIEPVHQREHRQNGDAFHVEGHVCPPADEGEFLQRAPGIVQAGGREGVGLLIVSRARRGRKST